MFKKLNRNIQEKSKLSEVHYSKKTFVTQTRRGLQMYLLMSRDMIKKIDAGNRSIRMLKIISQIQRRRGKAYPAPHLALLKR